MAFFDAANGASKKTMSNHLSWIHTNQCCCKRADGRWIKQNSNDQATLNGMPVAILQKLVKAVEFTFESYIEEKKCWAFI
jgi:hypothetical protein